DIASDATIDMPHVVAQYEGHYFIGADNGIFSLIFDHAPEKLVEVDMIQDTDTFTFSAYDIFIKVAGHLIGGGSFEEIGPERKSLTQRIALSPVTSGDLIKGHVIYIDSYENVFTNIHKPLFDRIGQKRQFRISFGSARYGVSRISQSYKDVHEGEILALFSSSGHLEIAISMGNAAGLLGLKVDDTVRVEFR
ncbi:MAG: S-adenosyl-l-methionine hydroxide adenosyltransferase family protein, partial [Bacteroidales bacterium]